VADAYEAMVANRPYRKSLGSAEAISELQRCSGTYFDPRVVDALVTVLAESGPEPAPAQPTGAEVDRYEARAVFVSIADGMLGAFRRLGGPRLTSNLEMSMSHWLGANRPAFSLSSGHISAHWEQLADQEEELAAMRATIAQLGELMAAVTGRSLVEHFYAETVDAMTERLRAAAVELELYRRA
jgi:hypothetical protein